MIGLNSTKFTLPHHFEDTITPEPPVNSRGSGYSSLKTIVTMQPEKYKPTPEERKKIDSIKRKLKSATDELHTLGDGWWIYLANNTANIMRGESHNGRGHATQENSIDSIVLFKWDGGDW